MKFDLPRITLVVGVLCASFAASPQTPQRPSFEVATVKPAPPLDMMKVAAEVRAGRMPKLGAHIDNSRAEYIYVTLRDLITMAYKVKPYQITGPDWLNAQRFDIQAKLPEGSSKADAQRMLQALLEDRFKLAVHRSTAEHPVLALVVAKGGPKLKESSEKPKAIDESTPLKEGESAMEGPDGQVRATIGKTGEATINMGEKGTISYGVNPQSQSMNLHGSMIRMDGLAELLTQFSGQAGGKPIVDMTGLKGVYEVQLEFAMADLLQMARNAGMDIPAGAGAPGGSPAGAASDPGGSSSMLTAIQALGLRLESRKAPIEQLIIDHVEKTPTEN